MAEDILLKIDETFAHLQQQKRPRPKTITTSEVEAEQPDEMVDEEPAPRWSWIEAFLVIQFMWGALLFVPGAQSFRAVVRAAPYLSSLVLLAKYLPRRVAGRWPAYSVLLIGVMLLLVLNLLHATTPLAAGIGQCIFQLSIAAPVFWVPKVVRSPKHLDRLLVLIFVMNFCSASLGVLQVYYPDRFMPPQFSAQLDVDYLSMLSYVGADGRVITRPPGLTDTPGGAALAGGLAAVVGIGLTLRHRKRWQIAALLVASAIALAAVYLTQVRSVLVMAVVGTGMLALVTFRQGRLSRVGWILTLGGIAIVGSFLWATSLGGDAVHERFLNLGNQGLVQSYQDNRGQFLSYTMGDLVNEYPLGAGVGRWGMINSYLGNPADPVAGPLYAEIQLTGWLMDGGLFMWVLYGGAIAFAMFAGFTLAGTRDMNLAELVPIAIAAECLIAGLGMTGPVFNTQMGLLFWLLVGAVHGAQIGPEESAVAPALG